MTVKTEMIENMPIVIPNNERKVRNLLTTTELTAKIKLSFNSLKNIFKIFKIKFAIKDKKNHNFVPLNLRELQNYRES
jgi:hypothetical protein